MVAITDTEVIRLAKIILYYTIESNYYTKQQVYYDEKGIKKTRLAL
jgi:hypothetical protein